MNINQIKRFFLKYGFPVSVRMNEENEIVNIFNKQFTIFVEDDNYWFSGFETTGEEVVYHDSQCPSVLFDMIHHGFDLTAQIFEEIRLNKI